MGKRKAAKKPQAKKKAEPLSSVFKCLFCNHEKAVTVKIDKQSMFGHLTCKVCGQRFTSPINSLSVPVDVYCDWVDACEEVRAKQPPKQRPVRAPSPLAHGRGGGVSFDVDKPTQEVDEDAEGEEEEYDTRTKSTRREVDEDDVDEDEDDLDDGGRREKRRRVRDDYDDEDDED
ncbi:hypothetical protein I302_104951 [Kwoniella bestiolae CBS 10118]|uniref:Transcription elongation factor 1 homolog n=1 Tax=Kwoniella bestiolae CBS 10118 TaxID=1296100 RepID=A0A1B9FRB8_9TREE|nr:hypothetical protein I302_08979 [Kwoniella bestiolae CBS 10118]OCF21306.1 hypothetical protein I302_08979 [Kwoniella bestiolae CBS 10118]